MWRNRKLWLCMTVSRVGRARSRRHRSREGKKRVLDRTARLSRAGSTFESRYSTTTNTNACSRCERIVLFSSDDRPSTLLGTGSVTFPLAGTLWAPLRVTLEGNVAFRSLSHAHLSLRSLGVVPASRRRCHASLVLGGLLARDTKSSSTARNHRT